MTATWPITAVLLAAATLAGGHAFAQTSAQTSAKSPRAVTLHDLHRLQDLTEPRLSPDGEWLAWVQTSHDLQRDATQSRIWRMRLDGTQRHPLNAPPKDKAIESQGTLQWGPRHELFFLGDRVDGVRQVFVQRIGEAEPRQLTKLPQGVNDYVVSPDGKRLALILDDPSPKPPDGLPEPPFVTERFQFMDGDNGIWLDQHRRHLYLFDIASGEKTALTRGDHDEWLPSWSPDGRQIAYVSKRAGPSGADPDRHNDYNLFLIEAQPGGRERQITDYPGSDLDPYWESRPAWSPDGARIAYLRGGEPKWLGYAPAQLAILDLATQQVSAPAHVDRFFYKPRWSARGDALYALREDAESTHLVRVDLAGDAATPLTPLTQGDRYDGDFDLDAEGRLIVLGNGDLAPAEVFAVEAKGLRALSKVNDEALASLRLQPIENLHFPSADGRTTIHAMLVKPPGWRPGQRVPTIVRLHGGPVYQFSHEFMFDWQWFAAQGYAVLAINPRGSSGRGFDFARAIYADWGRLDVADVLAAVDHVVELGIADPARLSVGGHSYGSILTNYVIASDTRFKAATSSAGSSSALTLYGLDMYARDYEIELGTPWSRPRLYARLSYPFLHADKIQTPTLFFCGGDDFNVPCAGAQQMYQALRSLGVPSRFVRFPNQGHALDVPSYIEFRLKSSLEWIERFTKAPAQ